MKNVLTTIICCFFIVFSSCKPEELTPIHELAENENILVFQRHSKGEGIQIVLVADAHQDETISTLYNMYSHLFEVEPYPALKEYFTVIGMKKEIDSLGITIYKDRYIGSKSYISRKIQETARLNSLHNTAIVIAVSPELPYKRSCCWLSKDHNEVSLSLCAYAHLTESYRRYVLAHEVGGHAIGALEDEYEEFEGKIPTSAVSSNKSWQKKGMLQNVIFSRNLPSEWKRLQDVFGDEVTLYEGARLYERGAYRSSEKSIMRKYTTKYNVVSEYLIWKSVIQHKGGIKTDMDEFIAYRQQRESRGFVNEPDTAIMPEYLHGELIKE